MPVTCASPDCHRAVFGRSKYCTLCKEAAKRRDWQRLKARARSEMFSDLSTAEIEAKLASGDAERKRTRQQCGRRTA